MHDQLQHRLTALADDAEGAVRIAPVSRVRTRGDRRRIRFMASQATAVGVLVALGVVAVGVAGGAGGPSTADVAAAQQIPDTLRLPREGDPGWQRSDDKDVVSAFTGCRADDPTRHGRTDARTLTGPGYPREEADAPTRATIQLFLYDSDQAAAAAFTALREGVAHCGWIVRLQAPDGAAGDELWANHYTDTPAAGHEDVVGERTGENVTGFRSGNAIFLISATVGGNGSSSYMSSMSGDAFMEVGEQLCTHLRICGVWSPSRGSSGPPTQLPSDVGASPTG